MLTRQLVRLRGIAVEARLPVIAQAVELAMEGMAQSNVPAMIPVNHPQEHVYLARISQVEVLSY